MDHSTAAVSSSSHPSASKNLRILIPEPVLRAPVAKTRNNTDRFPPLFLPQPPSSPQTDVCSSPEGNMANVNSNTCSNISDYDVVVALREGVQGVRDGCDSMDMVVTVPTIAMNNFQDVQEKAVKRVTLVTPPVTTSTQARNWAPGTSPRHLQSTNSTRGVSESLLFRQASIDVTGLNAQSLHDRPRSSPGSAVRAIGTRFGIATSRLSQAVSARGKTSPGPATRSASAMDNRFDDWPEYTPSRQEDLSALGRRHVSDLSFGVKDRKKDMLPVELLKEEGMDRKRCGNVDMEDRMVGKGWKKRLGIAAGVRELSDTRATVRSILRRRRKTLLSGSGDNTVRRMESHYGSEMSVRKAFNHERDYKFECELGLDTVFSLLTRICGDCGFVVTVRKCNHKMKVEVPWEGEGVPLLVSISLTRVAQGRNTCVTLSRSKDDESGGPGKEIEAASVLLQKRLSSHVEYIEDSFASLYFDGSINEMREEHSM